MGADSAESGFATVQHIVAASIVLVFFVVLTNLVVMQYGRAVMRSAADEGARAGALSGSGPGECIRRIGGVIGDLAGGALFADLDWECGRDGEWMVASVGGSIAGWVLVPDLRVRVEGRAQTEP